MVHGYYVEYVEIMVRASRRRELLVILQDTLSDRTRVLFEKQATMRRSGGDF